MKNLALAALVVLCGSLALSQQPQKPVSDVQRWEYKVFQTSPDRGLIETGLNDLGKQGWELYSSSETMVLHVLRRQLK
jgi:hypothetical protein